MMNDHKLRRETLDPDLATLAADDAMRILRDDPGEDGKRFRRFLRSAKRPTGNPLDDTFLHLPGDGTPGFLLINYPVLPPARSKKKG